MERHNTVERGGAAVRAALSAPLVMVLGACDGNSQLVTPYGIYNYGNVTPDVIWLEGDRFYMFDKPQENRLLGTHPWANWWHDVSLKQWRQVAAEIFERRGRNCEITRSHQVWPGEVESTYICG